MERRINMSDFTAFSDEIDAGMSYLKHHGILGQKWGKKEGPPYPLGSGDHSSAEKSAAKAAGVKIGSDSGKGSIANVKKKSTRSKSVKKEMTEEEKRAAAVEAVKSGDRKKIAKYASYLTSQELQDAENRVRNLSNITREEPREKKASKAEMEKQEVIRSGDKEKVREFADKMSYQELSEAMNRIDLNAKLYYEKPAPTALDKFSEAMGKVEKVRNAAEKGIAAYNTIAKVYNSTHKDGPMWPEIQAGLSQKKAENKKEQDVLDKLVDKAKKDVAKGVKETVESNTEKQAKKEAKEAKKAEKEEAKKQEQKQEPTEEKQEQPKTTRDINEGMVKPLREVSNQKMSDYDDFDYSSIFSESYMQSQRDVSMSTALATVDYENFRDSVRWSDF